MLHLVYGMNSPLISASLVRHSLLHFHLSHMAVHHLRYLHYHRLHLFFNQSINQSWIYVAHKRKASNALLLTQYFISNSRLGSSVNPFLHRPFTFLPD